MYKIYATMLVVVGALATPALADTYVTHPDVLLQPSGLVKGKVYADKGDSR